MQFVGFVHEGREGGFGISFPDLPGCIGAGRTVKAAMVDGARALNLHLHELAREGEGLPVARSLQQINADPELAAWRDGASLVLIEANIQTGTPKTG